MTVFLTAKDAKGTKDEAGEALRPLVLVVGVGGWGWWGSHGPTSAQADRNKGTGWKRGVFLKADWLKKGTGSRLTGKQQIPINKERACPPFDPDSQAVR